MGGTAVESDIAGGLFTVQIIRGGKINTFRKLLGDPDMGTKRAQKAVNFADTYY
jgi:hypothetical protein